MTISIIEQATKQFTASSVLLTLSVLRFIEGLLYRLKSESEEDGHLLALQIAALLNSLWDVHVMHRRKLQKLVWLEQSVMKPFASADVCQGVAALITLVEKSNIISKDECVARLMELRLHYENRETKDQIDDYKEVSAASAMPQAELAANKPAAPPLLLTTKHDWKRGVKRRQ